MSTASIQEKIMRPTSGSLPLRVYSSVWQIPIAIWVSVLITGWMKSVPIELTGVEDFDADFVLPGRCDLDLLNLQRLACAPADGGLALDNFSCSVRHECSRASVVGDQESRKSL